MKKYKVWYGLGGGFGGCERMEPEVLEFNDEEEARNYAWEMACQEYEMYDGLHGLRDIDTIMEEDEVDEEEAGYIWEEERESWLDYMVEEVKE